MELSIRGKVAVVTGGAGILCASMAQALAEHGAKVAVLDLRAEAAEDVAQAIESKQGMALGLGANVLSLDSLREARKKILERFGTIDILINGAGGNSPRATTSAEQSFFALSVEDIQMVMNLNFLGTVLPCQVFGEVIVAKKKGSIINISSMAAFTPLTRTIAYSAGKAAVSNFTQWAATHFSQEYSPEIRVNAIAPGFLLTEQNRYLLTAQETGELTERGRKIIGATPMHRFGLAEDLLGLVLLLCSDASAFINGAIIPIDGAFSAYRGV